MTEQGLIDAIQKLIDDAAATEVERPPGCFTTREVCDLLGLGATAVMSRLTAAAGMGLIEPTKFKYPDRWGDAKLIKGWKFTGKAG